MTPYEERTRAIRRRAAASRAAFAMHERHPDIAAEAGRKGGAARVAQHADAKAYGQWLARRRWHGALAGPAPTRTTKKMADVVASAGEEHDDESVAIRA